VQSGGQITQLNNVWDFLKFGLEKYPEIFVLVVVLFILFVAPVVTVAIRRPEALKYMLPWNNPDDESKENNTKEEEGSKCNLKNMEKVVNEVDESLGILRDLIQKVNLLKKEVSSLSKIMVLLQRTVDEGCRHLGQDCIQAVESLKGDIEEVKKELERREKSYQEWRKLEEERRKIKEERENLKYEDMKKTLADITKKIADLEDLLKDIEKTVKTLIGAESKGRFH